MKDARCRMPDAGYRMPDAGCRMPDTGYLIQMYHKKQITVPGLKTHLAVFSIIIYDK
jgi:hypothetical protein